MSMSTHVVGIKPPDDKWLQMKQAYDACVVAGVPIPDEVEKFFDYEPPDSKGVVVDIERHECTAEYSADMQQGFEIDITKLPSNVTIVRVYNSY